MMGKIAWVAIACILAGGTSAENAVAARTRSFLIEGLASFRSGRMNGVSLEEDGTVTPGPAAHALATDAGAQVWCLIRARDGSLYAGSGSDGAVYRVRDGQVDRAAQSFEYEVFALAEDSRGRLFAAGAPNGTIIEITSDGAPRTLFDTPEKIVWALLADKDGDLYAGTGERGYLYRVSPSGEGTVLYRAEDSHIVALAWSREGQILAGTDGRGMLLAIDPERGGAKVLYDAPLAEIPRIAVGKDGTVYFAACGTPPAEPKPDKPPEAGTEETPKARLYALDPDGTVRLLWRCPEETIHALSIDEEGRILVGTGGEAAVYRLTGQGVATLLWRPEEGQVVSLLAGDEEILAGTANPGRIYQLDGRRNGDAWIRPEPLDAESPSSWGRAVWEVRPGAGRWEIRTRSGHTERPDSSWSQWSEPLTDPEGSPIQTPPARFLQCEARYVGGGGGAPAQLRRIWVPYTEPNLPPRVQDVRFSSEDVPPQKEGAARDGSYMQDLGAGVRVQIQRSTPTVEAGAAEPLPPWVREVRSVVWSAEDPNGDQLAYEISLRQVGEPDFRILARDHRYPGYAMDTGTLPDGSYEVRIIASDAPSNAPGQALRSERVAGPFRVDHRSPEILELAVARPEPRTLVVTGRAQDSASPIRTIEVSWDGGAWRPVGPVDGFLDSRAEPFRVEIALEREEWGSWVAVRAVDAAGNESVGRVWLEPE